MIAYYSTTLSRPERNYCVTHKELLAIIRAVKHFHPYLYGRKFLLRTDHAALRWLLNFRNPEGQLARWLQTLQQYKFDIQHRSGTKHTNADALSRRPCANISCKHCTNLESCRQIQTASTSTIMESVTAEESVVNRVMDSSISGPGLYTQQDLKQAQLADKQIAPVLEWMEKDSVRPPWETVAPHDEVTKTYWAQWLSLQICNGVLYRLWESPTGDSTCKQIVLPKSLREDVLQSLHNAPSAGHFGVAKTLGRIRERFYWVQCRKEVKEYVQNCDVCAQRRGPPRKIRAPLQTYLTGSPAERIAVDILGPLPVTERGKISIF